MADPSFRSLVIRELDRIQSWNCDQDTAHDALAKRLRKAETRLAIIWWACGAAVVVIGFLLTILGWVLR